MCWLPSKLLCVRNYVNKYFSHTFGNVCISKVAVESYNIVFNNCKAHV